MQAIHMVTDLPVRGLQIYLKKAKDSYCHICNNHFVIDCGVFIKSSKENDI